MEKWETLKAMIRMVAFFIYETWEAMQPAVCPVIRYIQLLVRDIRNKLEKISFRLFIIFYIIHA